MVDARSAGSGEFVPVVKDEKGNDIPVSVTDHQNGQYTVEYTPPGPGKYKVNATYAGKQVPKLPVDINVTPPADVSKVKVDGLEPSKCAFHTTTLLSSCYLFLEKESLFTHIFYLPISHLHFYKFACRTEKTP